MSIYDKIVELGIEHDHHESDLYIPVTGQTRKLVKDAGVSFVLFENQVGGGVWFDIPFAYKPFWDKVQSRVV